MRDRADVQDVLFWHLGHSNILRQLCTKLRELRRAVEQSDFFKSHEVSFAIFAFNHFFQVVGNSLLIVHDGKQCGLWTIDWGLFDFFASVSMNKLG